MLKEIFVDINDYNKSFITATESDNNSDVYKIIITEDGRRFDLTDKTVQMAYAISYTDKGDILNLNVTNPTEGEITLEITNELTRKDGDYTCQLLILGENEYRRHSKYYFNLSIRENLFNKISGEIIKSPNIGILQELVKKAEFLNTQLENKNKVAENLNSNLNENISVADPLNNSLSEKIPEADTKKSQLEKSITKAKEFIDGLDGSQNIPQLRLDVTELQNGLKSNQSLEYSGSSITANDTLEGRTEGMKIKGRTLQNLFETYSSGELSTKIVCRNKLRYVQQTGKIYTLVNNTNLFIEYQLTDKDNDAYINTLGVEANSIRVYTLKENEAITRCEGLKKVGWTIDDLEKLKKSCLILEGDWTNKSIPNFFEGLKNFGEAEQEGDKYKISILSGGLNRCTNESINGFININVNNSIQADTTAISYIAKVYKDGTYYLSKTGGDRSVLGYFKSYPKIGDIALNVASGSITVPSHGYIVAYVSSNKNTNKPTNIMISEKSSCDFHPYQEDKKDILISAPLPGFDFGEDIMYEENGQVKITRNIDTYTFTGDENMRDTTEQDEKSGTGKYKVFALTVNKTIDINKNINNNFPKEQFNVAFQNMDSEGLAVTQYGVYIKILKSKLSTQDTEGFKDWLKANITTIYFARATPVTEIVENCIDIDLDTYQEKTYFNILNSLPGTLDFKVPSNIGSVVQNMAKEVNNIWDVINNLLVPSIVKANGNLAMLKLNNNLN